MNRRAPDYFIIAVNLIGVVFLGKISGSKQKTIKDFFPNLESVFKRSVCFPIIESNQVYSLYIQSFPGAFLMGLFVKCRYLCSFIRKRGKEIVTC